MNKIVSALHWYLAFGIQGDCVIFTHLVRPHCGNGIERIFSRTVKLKKIVYIMLEIEEANVRPFHERNN